ncbi:MAG: metallophosphoesterase family protein [Acidobacteriota bacterium]
MSQRPPEDDARKKERGKRRVDSSKLTAHRGLATWGEKLVPLAEFRAATQEYGRVLDAAGRSAEVGAYLEPKRDVTPVEGPYSKITVFGGIYNNSYGLEALLEQSHGADAIYCLGDFGGFGPHPEKVWPLLEAADVLSIQGNYEESLASGREDCNCGYADPRDNHYAEISYRYTAERCSDPFKRYLGSHPRRRRVRVGDRELLLIHGSPRRVNEFLFESTASVPFLEVLLDQEQADGILCTHSGLQWHRRLPSGRDVVNVGVIGRPANDGSTRVWYAELEDRGDHLGVDLRPLRYDHQSLARDMRAEGLPEVFVDTILTGWWTTCLEILPAKERASSRF